MSLSQRDPYFPIISKASPPVNAILLRKLKKRYFLSDSPGIVRKEECIVVHVELNAQQLTISQYAHLVGHMISFAGWSGTQ